TPPKTISVRRARRWCLSGSSTTGAYSPRVGSRVASTSPCGSSNATRGGTSLIRWPRGWNTNGLDRATPAPDPERVTPGDVGSEPRTIGTDRVRSLRLSFRLATFRLDQFDRLPGRVLDDGLLPAHAVDSVVAELELPPPGTW